MTMNPPEIIPPLASAAQHNEKVAVTVLPNGRTPDNGLKLTLLFTLSLPKDQSISQTWFENWTADDPAGPGNIGALLRKGSWTFKFFDSVSSAVPLDTKQGTPQPYRRYPELWTILFADKAEKAKYNRRSTRDKTPWHVAHDAAFTEYVIKNHRYARAAQQFSKRHGMAFRSTAQATLDGQFDSIDVYLHPKLGDTSATSIQDQLKARADLLSSSSALWIPTLVKVLINPNTFPLLTERFQYGLCLLDSADQPLAPLGLLALWRHCALSLPSDPNFPIDAVIAKIETTATSVQVLASSLSQAQSIIEFLLTSRKKEVNANCAAVIDPPDFHQMLGMVNRYPALLRPLGLAVDVVLPLPANSDKAVLVSVTPPVADSAIVCFPTAIYIGNAGGHGGPEFCARSRYDDLRIGTPDNQIDDCFRLLQNRYLWLAATSKVDRTSALFWTTSHDGSGMTHKMVNASFSFRRGSQYRHYATKNDAEKPAPDTLPSLRSTGIQLLHVARVARSQQVAANQPDMSAPRVLYADDLILGYRVDMYDGRNDGTWFALCARRTLYESLDGTFTWQPSTAEDFVADEGFVTLGGLVEDDGGSTVIRMHQAVCTWNGENLSVKPFFDTKQEKPTNPIFRIIPTYFIPSDHSELPMRFEKRYDLRCRMVDLAGNSPRLGECIPLDSAGENVVTISHDLLREEPFRGPQLLLRDPIDRAAYPGENISTLVLRDGHGSVERAVVPPRETRQLVERAGKLDHDLPRGAFEEFWLDRDTGRFITAQEEEHGGPIKAGDIDAEEQDGILRLQPTQPKHRYFPDPHILHACIQFKPPGDFTPWQKWDPQYLSFYKEGREWPHASPVLLRLFPSDDSPHAKVTDVPLFPPNSFADTPALNLYLPKATDAIIELSSAAYTASNPAENPMRLAIEDTSSRIPASAHPTGRGISAATHGSFERPTLVATNSTASKIATQIPDAVLLQAMGINDQTAFTVQIEARLRDQGIWGDGQHPVVSPVHQIRLVHAVKQPLRQPVVTDLALTRKYGETIAYTSGSLDPCIRSTGKITFHASYELYIDDPARPEPYYAPYNETAFEIALPSAALDPTQTPPKYLEGKQHIFNDNRARSIIYSTVATSRFLGFYPDTDHQSRFEITQTLPAPVKVAATVRPPAPVISYIIPAFRWDATRDENGTYKKTRTPYLRVYMERPHVVTDNDQMLGVVVASSSTVPLASSPANLLVSKIGMDPTQGTWTQVGLNKVNMDPTMFTNQAQVGAGFLVESTAEFAADQSATGAVDILAFKTQFLKKRNLWFADIAIQAEEEVNGSSFHARSPFVQLALTRYAPNGLVGTSPLDDARMSAVVVADFMQLAEDRCCTLARNGKSITLCISGPFVAATGSDKQAWCPSRRRWEWTRETRISVELQHRWHSVDGEESWLPVDPKVSDPHPFKFVADDEHGLGALTITFNLPHSPAWFKYAVLVMEEEIIPAKDSSTSEIYRARYFDQIEI
jgi:hypothetical protein